MDRAAWDELQKERVDEGGVTEGEKAKSWGSRGRLLPSLNLPSVLRRPIMVTWI